MVQRYRLGVPLSGRPNEHGNGYLARGTKQGNRRALTLGDDDQADNAMVRINGMGENICKCA